MGHRPASYMLWNITRMFSTRTNQVFDSRDGEGFAMNDAAQRSADARVSPGDNIHLPEIAHMDSGRPGHRRLAAVTACFNYHFTERAHAENFVGLIPDSFAIPSMSVLYPTRSNHSSMIAYSMLF